MNLCSTRALGIYCAALVVQEVKTIRFVRTTCTRIVVMLLFSGLLQNVGFRRVKGFINLFHFDTTC